MLRPGKEGRRREPDGVATALRDAGIPVAHEVAEPAIAEGGDTVWLDERTLLVGHGYRTNGAGIAAARGRFPGRRGDRVRPAALERRRRGDAPDVARLAARRRSRARLPAARPVRLLELLAERGIRTVEVPDAEFETLGSNVLALGPRRALALEGNDETRRRLERAGVDIVTYRGEEISRKGDGGPTCLTRPILRD